ncbi:hypothetical protein [Enterococcus gilvus]|uniref:hypothetical protein n=1 Tax=Enterococcus gilvus TaxID=160453 RepID=UPI003EDAC605
MNPAEDIQNGTVVLAKIDLWSGTCFFCHKGFYYRISFSDAQYYYFRAAGFRIRKELLYDAFEPTLEHRTYPVFDDPALRLETIETGTKANERKHPFKVIRQVLAVDPPGKEDASAYERLRKEHG